MKLAGRVQFPDGVLCKFDVRRSASGIGRILMSEAESRLRGVGCHKINLQVRRDNREAIAFYEAIGFMQDDVVSFGKRLADESIRENQRESKP